MTLVTEPTLTAELDSLESRCQATLLQNTLVDGGYTYTSPNANYYGPHRWLWDSGLVVEGIATHAPRRAAEELVSFIDCGQWEDGMIPHQILTGRSPETYLWGSKRSPIAPKQFATSSVTQPPLLAEAVQETAKQLPSEERRDFIVWSIGRLASYHEWLHTARDFGGNGLFSVVHPYETGMDNNPALMQHIRSVDWGISPFTFKALRTTSNFFRHDKRFNPDTRATLDDTTFCTAALLRLRHTRYDRYRIRDTYPFQVEDVHFNSVLIRNDRILRELAEEVSYPLPDELSAAMERTRQGLETLWDDTDQMYYSRDAASGRLIRVPTIASLMPLYAGSLPKEREQSLLGHLRNPETFSSTYPVPSTPLNSPYYRYPGYWDGATWPFTNHLLTRGLGEHPLAARMDCSWLRMVCRQGPCEYFSAATGKGYGTADFSPTAALTLVILDRRKTDLLRSGETTLEAALQSLIDGAEHTAA